LEKIPRYKWGGQIVKKNFWDFYSEKCKKKYIKFFLKK
jgi:hypothetical protein